MKVKIFGLTISTARRIRNKLELGMMIGKHISNPKEWGYVMGVYDSRIFGMCIYRNNFNCA